MYSMMGVFIHVNTIGKLRINNRTKKKIKEIIGLQLRFKREHFKSLKKISIGTEYARDYQRLKRQFVQCRKNLLEISDRQAILMNWKESDLTKHNTCPCILYIQFFKENNKITTIVNLRSSDVENKLKNDMRFVDLVRKEVFPKHRHGDIIAYLNSAHIYVK